MKGIVEYLNELMSESYMIEFNEELLNESAYECYHYHDSRFNFNLVAYGHPIERSNERVVSNEDITALVKDCWSRILKGIDRGDILIDQVGSGNSGSQICLHSSEKDDNGFYLSVVIFIKKHIKHNGLDYYVVVLKTVFNGKKVDSWKVGVNGKSMYHPEYGQLDMWDSYGISSGGYKDVMKVKGGRSMSKKPRINAQSTNNYTRREIGLNVKGFIDLDKLKK